MSPQGENLLDVRNVTKTFGSLIAVSNVSLSVSTGELHAVIGPNGAGKTTFFNLISGMFSPDDGEIVFVERMSRNCRPTAASRAAWCERSRSPKYFRRSRCAKTSASPLKLPRLSAAAMDQWRREHDDRQAYR